MFANVNEITESIFENEKNLNDAAHEIADLFRPSASEKDRGVIVVAVGYPKIKKKHSKIHSFARCK